VIVKAYSKTLYINVWVLLISLCSITPPIYGQTQPSNHSELEELKSELKQIAARIDALEAADNPNKTATASGISPATSLSTAAASISTSSTTQPSGTVAAISNSPINYTPPSDNGPESVMKAEQAGMDTMDAGMGGMTIDIPHLPEMKVRGFGDVRYIAANQNLAVINSTTPGVTTLPYQAGSNTFELGIMDMFITSQITKQFSYLTEMGYEADWADNNEGVDLERAQLSWTPSNKFSLNIGRSHAMLGYYNTAFHHGTWFQTTIDRPHFFEFEDTGGPLPIHNVGLEAMGKVPHSSKLGLEWFGEVGNGKQTYSLQSGVTPANVLADHTGKSTNIGMYARPQKIDGLQFGFNWYQAALVPVVALLPGYGTANFVFPNAVDYYRQNIYMAHVVYITSKNEFMVEDGEMRDLPRGSSKPLYTSGGYAQYSRLIANSWRPYFRYQWQNPNFNDPNTAWVGRWVGPNVGVRYDLNTFIGLKFEYSHFDWKNFSADASGNQILPIVHKTIEMFGTQITYTF